jgi:probable rRNA maturation factor
MEIIFNNSKAAKVDERLLKKLAGIVAGSSVAAGRKAESVSVSFVSEKKMRELNKRYRKKDRPTDVLSFELNEDNILGDVVICPGIARENAKKYKVSYMDETSRLFVHGLLHLMGLDHGKKMFGIQDSILGGA